MFICHLLKVKLDKQYILHKLKLKEKNVQAVTQFPMSTFESSFSNLEQNQKCKILQQAESFLYKGRFIWIADKTGLYRICNKNDLSNDFKLRYWTSGADIPLEIKAAVKKKFKELEKPSANLNKLDRNERAIMCCYDFCYLTLIKAGVVSKEQMDDLFCIAAASIKRDHEDSYVTTAQALYANEINRLYAVDAEHTPSQGDVVAFKREGHRTPFHYAIWAGENSFIELNDEAFWPTEKLTDFNFIIKESTPQRDWPNEIYYCKRREAPVDSDDVMYYIPQSEIAKNVADFIQNNKEKWSEIEDKFTEQSFLSSLYWSQYKPFITAQETITHNDGIMSINVEYFVKV